MDSKQAMFLIIIALVLYLLGLLQSRKYNYGSSVVSFCFGFVFDCLGTWSMYQRSLTWEIHSILGIVAIFLMGILALGGVLGLVSFSDKFLFRFRQFAPLACGIWILSFLSGAVSHML